MSFNPDDTDSLREENQKKDDTIKTLRDQNEDLKRQISELTERLSSFQREDEEDDRDAAGMAAGGASRGIGRRSIPFSRRTAKQHQGRMAYLLKKLEQKNTWTQDAIADLYTYFVAQNIEGAGDEFFRACIFAFAGENAQETITDIDLFLAMLQP